MRNQKQRQRPIHLRLFLLELYRKRWLIQFFYSDFSKTPRYPKHLVMGLHFLELTAPFFERFSVLWLPKFLRHIVYIQTKNVSPHRYASRQFFENLFALN